MTCTCAAAGVDHNQQFHQSVINGFAGGLNQEYIRAADGFLKGNRSFTVGKGLDGALAHVQTEFLADSFCKFGIGVAAENLDVISVRNHR